MFCACADMVNAASMPTNIALSAHRRATRILPINRRNCSPRVIGAQDGPVVRAGACTPDRAPLTHPDAVAVAVPPYHDRGESAIGLSAVHRKVGAVENLA